MTRFLPLAAAALCACGTPTAAPTWNGEVATLVQDNCTTCHVRGGIAPLPLESYDDVAAAKDAMLVAVKNKTMPPWQLSEGCGSFRGERRLTQQQIDTLAAWVKAGVPKGADAPTTIAPPAGKALDHVDWQGAIAPAFTPPSDRTDQYQCFTLDPKLTSIQDVTGYDVVPDKREEVHHVLLFSVPRDVAQQLDDADPNPGWSCFNPPIVAGTRALGVWVPGTSATVFPSGTGVRMGPNDVVVMQMHYNTLAGVRAPDASTVKLQFAARAVSTQLIGAVVGPTKFSIPPYTSNFVASGDQDVPVDMTLFAVMPHMHLLGQKLDFTVTHAADTTCLANVEHWRFDWQELVFYQRPVKLQAGDKVSVKCTYDNTTDATVSYGEGTSDEMCLVLFMASL